MLKPYSALKKDNTSSYLETYNINRKIQNFETVFLSSFSKAPPALTLELLIKLAHGNKDLHHFYSLLIWYDTILNMTCCRLTKVHNASACSRNIPPGNR